MEIANPRRILVVSLAESAQRLSDVVRELTGTPPAPSSPAGSLAGTTHQLALSTPYYSASVPVWLDLVSDPSEWASSFLSPEAREVLDVLGGVIVVFDLPPPSSSLSPHPSDPPADVGSISESPDAEAALSPSSARARGLINHVGRVVREGLGGWEWDGVGLGVGVGDADPGSELLDVWDDACAEWGLEFVHVPAAATKARESSGNSGSRRRDEKEASGEEARNEFGEKMGISRALEALQSNDWSQAELDAEGNDGGSRGSSEFGDLGVPSAGRQKIVTASDDAGDDVQGDEALDPEALDFGIDKEDLAGLRKAIWAADREEEGGEEEKGEKEGEAAQPGDPSEEDIGEEDVRKLQDMMQKLLAVRDTSAGLPEEQRKRLARRAVGEVMKELA